MERASASDLNRVARAIHASESIRVVCVCARAWVGTNMWVRVRVHVSPWVCGSKPRFKRMRKKQAEMHAHLLNQSRQPPTGGSASGHDHLAHTRDVNIKNPIGPCTPLTPLAYRKRERVGGWVGGLEGR